MPFRFEWRDSGQRVMAYIAEGDWNWRDYHQAVRASAFTLMAADQPVDSVIDLRGSGRRGLPAGAAAHVRSFGRVTQANLSGRALVIGLGPSEIAALQARADGTLETADGFVKFVGSEAELERVLAEWAEG